MRPVRLAPTGDPDPALEEIATRSRQIAGDVDKALSLAAELGTHLPGPGDGQTAHLWSALATIGAQDLTVARVIEPHLDALAILQQAQAAGTAAGSHTWGVYAAEGPGPRLTATQTDGQWLLTGRKNWCSLASRLDRALVTAWVGEERGLFAVDLHHPGVRVDDTGTWVAKGLPDVDSGPIDLTDVPAEPVGKPGWYLTRPGFAWGGIGVAAIWFGGAVGVARRVYAALHGPRTPDQVAAMHVGACDVAVTAARTTLAEAATRVDSGDVTDSEASLLALRTRSVVASSAETVLEQAAHALGPGPLAMEAEHAARVADLQLYVRQWHAARDYAALGTALAPTAPRTPW